MKMNSIDIRQSDVLSDMKTYPDHYFNTIFADPPYQLGSQWVIDEKGQPAIKLSADFMGMWQAFAGEQWDEFFRQSNRILKHGGYCVLFCIERQSWVIPYYAVKHGFTVCQSLAWYFSNGFPKAVDASKMIDARLGFAREVIGQGKDGCYNNMVKKNAELGFRPADYYKQDRQYNITAPASVLARMFKGYKYGIAPFKPALEHILILRKPLKNDSVLDDLMAYQEDDTINPAVINIDESRVPTDDSAGWSKCKTNRKLTKLQGIYRASVWAMNDSFKHPNGRFPSQLFVDETMADVIDKQSGICKSGDNCIRKKAGTGYSGGIGKAGDVQITYGDEGGLSRMLHVCHYEQEDIELLKCCPKTSQSERDAGLDRMPTKLYGQSGGAKQALKNGKTEYKDSSSCGMNIIKQVKNNHPTVKPLSLTKWVAMLFKLPKECNQQWYVPFAGVFSEVIGIHKAGVLLSNITACEINPDYIEIGKARLEYWRHRDMAKPAKRDIKATKRQCQLFDTPI